MQKTLIYVDANTKRQILSNGASADRVANYVTLERGQWNILCLWFKAVTIDTTGEVIVTDSALSASSSYLGVGDDDFIDSTSLMFQSLMSATPFSEFDPNSNMFNLPGDWIDGTTADMTKGQMSIRINCDTAKFIAVMQNKAQVTTGLYMNIKMYDPGLELPSTIAWLPFVGANTIKNVTSSQIIPSDGYASIQYTNAVIMGGMDRQFSSDGVNEWHDSQNTEDEYFRERSRVLEGEWSDAIGLFRGRQGDSGQIGTTFTPSVDSAGNLSWSNDSGAENPQTVNIKGEKGVTFTPAVDSSGNLSWTNDSGEDNPATVNIKGEKGDSGTGLNPRGEYDSGATYVMTATARDTVQFQGSYWSCKVESSSGNEPPVYPITSNNYWDLVTAKGNDGATFIPSVDSAGNLSWVNSAGLENPPTINIKGEIGSSGATYLPAVDSAGNLSWSNNAGLTNPDTVNIKGADGQFENGVPDFEFTSSDLTNGVLTKTFAELGIVGECPVEVYDSDGYKKDGDSQVIVRWITTGLTVDVSAISGGITGTWTLKFAGGVSGVDVIVTSSLPEIPDSGTLYLIPGDYEETFPVIVESVDTDEKTVVVQRLQRDSGNTGWENYGDPITVFYDWGITSANS